jgi:streptogrisin D
LMDSDMPVTLEAGQAGARDAGGGASDAGPVPLEAGQAGQAGARDAGGGASDAGPVPLEAGQAGQAGAADTGEGSMEGPAEET